MFPVQSDVDEILFYDGLNMSKILRASLSTALRYKIDEASGAHYLADFSQAEVGVISFQSGLI